jgi:hypothetical protein
MNRVNRRKALKLFVESFVKSAKRPPNVSECEAYLKPIGLKASRRTVWIDLRAVLGATKYLNQLAQLK